MRRTIVLLALVGMLAALLPVAAAGAADTGGVRGTVTDVLGNPIEGIRVEGYVLQPGGFYEDKHTAWTNAEGEYEIDLHHSDPATLKLYFHDEDPAAPWTPEWHRNKSTLETANPVEIAAGGKWVAVNASLIGPGWITGRVTATGTGTPLEGIVVTAYPPTAGVTRARSGLPSYTTGADGKYSILVAPGSYQVLFSDSGNDWADRWHGGGMIQSRATEVRVTRSAQVRVNAKLVPGGAVWVNATAVESGLKVTDDEPGSEFCFEVYDAFGGLVASRRGVPEHSFRFGLPPALYHIKFTDCDAPTQFATSWYPSSRTRSEAAMVNVCIGSSHWRTINTARRCEGTWPTIIGTAGDDIISGTAARDVIVTGMGDDEVLGKSGPDLICLGEGDDYASGGRGRDEIYGHGGDDFLRGGEEADLLFGGDGLDRLLGDAGPDSVQGGRDGDQLSGGPGVDTINGGTGRDTVSYSGAEGAVTVNLNAGTGIGNGADTLLGIENVIGSRYADRLIGDARSNRIVGGAENDTILGGPGDDNLLGASGDDDISGGPGDDVLRGLRGDDTLNGGTGNDTLHGGAGTDTCTSGPIMTSC